MSRAAIAILSTENLLHNLAVMKAHLSGAKVIAMVKANAYGHGLRSVAMRLDADVASFGVASLEEAMALRKVGLKKPITLMEGVFNADDYLIAACQKFHVVLHDDAQVQWLKSNRYLPSLLHIWIKIDTGMGRLGFSPETAKEIYHELKEHSAIHKPIGLMSHFACADDISNAFNQQQIMAFQDLAFHFPGSKSFANSAAILNFPNAQYDYVRPGLSLYGVSPIAGVSAADLGLKPVMTFQTRLISIRNFTSGSKLGYGARFVCPENMPVGVIAIGYGDGYPGSAPDGMPVLVNGVRCQLVGRVSMDMATIDLRNCPQAKVGDSVTLWGEGLPIEEIAKSTFRPAYELLCGVQPRVKFHWTLA